MPMEPVIVVLVVLVVLLVLLVLVLLHHQSFALDFIAELDDAMKITFLTLTPHHQFTKF